MSYASARQIVFDAAEAVNPADHTTVAESAARNLRVIVPDGDLGNWSATEAPYIVEPMNLVRSRLYESMLYIGASRSGKTFGLVDAPIAFTIVDDPADCGVYHMTREAAETWAEKRLDRGIKGSPELKKRLSPHAHDDNKLRKIFRNGMEIEVGWQSRSQMSQKDLRRVFIPDADNATGTLKIAESFGFGLARTRSFGTSGMLFVEGNPAEDFEETNWKPAMLANGMPSNEAPPAPGLMALYNTGDRRRWWWPCPECKRRFMARPGLANFAEPNIEDLRERVMVDNVVEMAAKLALMLCPFCGVLINPRWQKSMNRAGTWVGEGQIVHDDGTTTGDRIITRRATFWAAGVMSCYDNWFSMWERWLYAVKQWSSTGDTKPIKTEMNTGQAMPFMPAMLRTKHDESALLLRAIGTWSEGTVPDGVRFLLCLIDVQAGRRSGFPCLIVGIGEHGQRWIIDRFHLRSSRRRNPLPSGDGDQWLRLDPATYPEDWDRLTERCVNRVCELANDPKRRVMKMHFVACDSGGKGGIIADDGSNEKIGGVTRNGYTWWRSLRSLNLAHKVLLLKGDGNVNSPIVEVTWPDGRKRQDRNAGNVGDVPLLRINANRIKDVVTAGVWRDPGPGAYHFPAWCKQPFFDELQVESKVGGVWKNLGDRPNEALDQLVYCEALLEHLGVNHAEFWKKPPSWADVWDRNPLVYAPEQPPTPVAALPRRPASDFWKPRR